MNKIIILFSLFMLLQINSVNAWYSSDYNYRFKLNQTTTDVTYNNYSIFFPITYDSNMQTDFDDILLVAGNDTTELPFWMSNKTDSSEAWIFFNSSLTINTNQTFYIYYGNSTVSSSSSLPSFFQQNASHNKGIDQLKDTRTTKVGVRILAKRNMWLYGVVLGAVGTETKAYIMNEYANVTYRTADITSYRANFTPFKLESGKQYIIATDKAGSSRAYYGSDNSETTNPAISSTHINWTGSLNWDGGILNVYPLFTVESLIMGLDPNQTDYQGAEETQLTITVNQEYNETIYETTTQNITLNILSINASGTIANISINHINFNDIQFTPNYTLTGSNWINSSYQFQQQLILVNDTNNSFNWSYNVTLTNGTIEQYQTDNENQTVLFSVFINNLTAPNILEGEDFYINGSVSEIVSGMTTKSLDIEWNQTNYTVFGSISAFYSSITSPLVDDISIVNYTAILNVSDGFVNRSRTFSYQNQTIYNLIVTTNCGGSNVTHNFTFFDEANLSKVLSDSSFFINLTSVNDTAGFYWLNKTYVEICINPYTVEFSANVDIEYTADDYEIRHYYLRNNTFSNITQNISLYLINETSGQELSITIFDSGGSLVSGAVVIAEKNPFLNVTYSRVDMGITAPNGKTSVFLEADKYYNFIVIYQGNTFDLGQIKIGLSEIVNGISLNLNPSFIIPFLTYYNNINILYTNVSSPGNQTVIQISTIDGSSVVGNLKVTKEQGLNVTTLCNNSTSGNAFIMTCSLGKLEGVYKIRFNIDLDGGKLSLISDVLDYGTFIDFGGDVLWVVVIFVTVLSFLLGGFPYLVINLPQFVAWTFKQARIFNVDRIYLVGFTILSLVVSYIFNMIKDGD